MNHLFRVARDDTSQHNTYYTATGLQDTVLALQSKSCQTSKEIKYSYIEQIKTRKHATCSINMVSPCPGRQGMTHPTITLILSHDWQTGIT